MSEAMTSALNARSAASPSDRRAPRHAPRAAVFTGAVVGLLGGLLGLGGAEFRLPVLAGYFRYRLHTAVGLNLAISFITVVAGAASRLAISREVPEVFVLPIGVAMMLGGIAGAAAGSRWLASMSDARLHRAVRTLLVGIGLLLVIESMSAWEWSGVPVGTPLGVLVACCAGVLIGIVSTLLGVAGGELIIPTLVFLFGVPIKAAGTLSVLISIPTMLVGLRRHQIRGSFRNRAELRALVVPMGIGSVAGGLGGGALIGLVPSAAVKLLLGALLIGSAVKIFHVSRATE